MEKYYKASDIGALIEKLLKKPYYQHEGESWYSGVSAVWDELMCLDTVELEEPKVGEWKFTEPDTHGNKKPYCSNCGEYHLSSWSDYTNCSYCSNCGAKMIEESANG